MSRKVAVVTGGNKGIGYAIVKGLCQQLPDYDVLLTARDEGRGNTAVEELKKEHGINPKFYMLDIANPATVANLKKYLQDTYGGLDILVNNAGIAYKGSSTAPFSEQAEVSMATNFTGTLDVCDQLFPLLRPGARVVHLSSRVSTMALNKMDKKLREKFNKINTMDEAVKEMTAFVQATKEGQHKERGYPDSAYGMSKVGVTVMTGIQQAAVDKDTSKTDIVVNSCCPGYVNTDMSSHKGQLTIEQGADTPIYLATLPPGCKSPRGNFVCERKINDWRTSGGWS